MDPQAISILDEIRKHTPRYVFRAWSNSGWLISGGHVGLNTTKAITPLAFARGRGAACVNDLTVTQLFDLTQVHLIMRTDIDTQFSSWTASLSFAMEGRIGYTDNEDAYISIVDTKKVSNPIFCVPMLGRLWPYSASFHRLNFEYLGHGVIQGEGLRALPLKVFRTVGFCIEDGTARNDIQWFPFNPDPDMTELVCRARKIGEEYGGDFVLPMTLALICRNKRDWKILRDGVSDLAAIIEGLNGLTAPDDWLNDDTIMKDIVDVRGWVEVELLIMLMRALAEVRRELRKLDVDMNGWRR